MTALPWRDLMRFGFGTLRLSPSEFWALTVPEITAAIEAHFPKADAPARADFQSLLHRFPDAAGPEER